MLAASARSHQSGRWTWAQLGHGDPLLSLEPLRQLGRLAFIAEPLVAQLLLPCPGDLRPDPSAGRHRQQDGALQGFLDPV